MRAGWSVVFASYFILATSYLFSQSGWGPDQRLVFMQGGGWDPRAACCGDTVHLVWKQRYSTTIPHEEVFYKRSTDAGETWSLEVLLSNEDNIWSCLPDIGVFGSYVHVIWWDWQRDMILYRRSLDGGMTWEPEDSVIPRCYGYHCAIAVDSSNVYVVSVHGRIWFTKSTNNGESWQPCTLIADEGTNRVRIACDDNYLYVVAGYPDFVSVNPEIMFVRSSDRGDSWSSWQTVSQIDTAGSQAPALAAGNALSPSYRGVYVTWYDYKYTPYAWTGDIFFRASRDAGNTWDPIDSLTVMHRAVNSDILAEGNNLHLVWEDERHNPGNNFEIYYRMSSDLGLTWGQEERLTNAPYWSIRPSLACGGGYLHLFWRDCRESLNNGIGFIYYKRKDLASVVSELCHQKDMSEFLTVFSNPFKEQTLITFFLPDVVGFLEVYDASGRMVFKKEVSGKGQKEVQWQTDRVGVYFIRLRTINKTIIKKVVALR